MEIKPVKIIRSTKKAFYLEWYDFNWNGTVQAWMPRSQVKIERLTAYLSEGIYKTLNIKRKSNKP